jgi:nitrogen fixation/metabolism regulation signal transduction histidine kinase
MAYRNFKSALLLRAFVLLFSLIALAFAINMLDFSANLPFALIIILLIAIVSAYSFRNLYKFTLKRFAAMDDFLESVKYRDFSRLFVENSGPFDLRKLNKGFNDVNRIIREINNEKEAQYLYLKKILELIETGIIAYHIKTGEVLWVNDSFKKNLNIPSLKSIHFIEKRNPGLFDNIFNNHHVNGNSIAIEVNNEKVNFLISSSSFQISDDAFKLIVIQNIDDTLNRTQSEAWKKLLSVMTHEIMNSIAPISSLAETLQSKVRLSIKDPVNQPLEINDLETGIESIKKRSEGLLKFAKTYRSLNKTIKLNLSKTPPNELFKNIKILMQPSLENKDIELDFKIDNPDMQIEMDTYLLEQVLINLILNSVEACKEIEKPKIVLSAQENIDGSSIISVADNGNGIPKEIIEDIFIPFFSTKKNGSGIGLSLCKQIIMLHNGKIQVKSAVGKGTKISLVLIN